MRNHGKKKNYCLIAALASLVAFSTMAASVMSGCGENSGEQKTTEIVHETRIDTQIETKIETYTEVVTDAQGNTEYVEETKAVPVNNNNAGADNKSGNSGNNSANSSSSSSGKNSNNQQSSAIEKSESSKTTNNSSSKTDTGRTDNNSNKNNNNNSNKNNDSSSSKSDSSKSDDSNNKTLKIGGKTFNVGDTIVCTYNLTAPSVLENYQATIKYDSSKLTCKSAKMSGEAKSGAMLNKKISGEISLSGVNISDGYDYTNGGTFMTVTYEVTGGGSTSPSYHWEVACRASDSKNLIDKKGNPASGFKLTSSYTEG